MKNTIAAFSIMVLFTQGAFADLELSVITQYEAAENEAIWKKTKVDRVPEAIITRETMTDPGAAYSALFPKTFFQEQDFSVCLQDCKIPDSFKVTGGETKLLNGKNELDILEQSNVYYWLKKYFSFLDEKYAFKPSYHLNSFTHREVKEDGRKMLNNAFFDPQDLSLSFLPADKGFLFRLMQGKINRSGFDPSVIAHEVSHYLFFHLYPHAINPEIGGLNEGFADYIAHAFLNHPKVGLVMLRGKALRDASNPMTSDNKPKIYSPGLEVHDLGERISFLLWKIRSMATDPIEMDRMVLESIRELAQTPYGTIHDFKSILLEKLPYVLSAPNLTLAQAQTETVIPGARAVIENTDFLAEIPTQESTSGFTTKVTMTPEFAKKTQQPLEKTSTFFVSKEVSLGKNQVALLTTMLKGSYWYVIDTERNNILGIYTQSGELITDEKVIESLNTLTLRTVNFNFLKMQFINNVVSYIKLFNDQGDLSSIYKIKERNVTNVKTMLNALPGEGRVIEMVLKKKLLGKVLPGVEDIDKISILTSKTIVPKWLMVDNESVIGYLILLKNGTESQFVFSHLAR